MNDNALLSCKIMILDDLVENVRLLEKILCKEGYRNLKLLTDPREFQDAFLAFKPDLILLDLMMPHINGFEILSIVNGHRKGEIFLPVLVISADISPESRNRALESGAEDFIVKPFDAQEVNLRVRILLHTRSLHVDLVEAKRKLEAQNLLLEENFEQLHKVSELKDEFLRIASHDLKNPLTCILGFASIIERSITPGAVMTEKAHELLPRIILQTRTMEKIITDFLDFQAMDDGRIKPAPEPLDLNEIARYSVEQNAGYAERKDISLAPELAENLPMIHADASQINQVVDNLVSNAIKFSKRTGRVSVQTRQADGHVFFEVRDCGPGLTDDDMELLFVKYARLSNKPTGGEKSSGLGLAICKRMIDLNGGEIGARNNDDCGATFWFELPIWRSSISRHSRRGGKKRAGKVVHISGSDGQ